MEVLTDYYAQSCIDYTAEGLLVGLHYPVIIKADKTIPNRTHWQSKLASRNGAIFYV